MNYRRLLLLAAVVGMVALAGCSTGGDGTTTAPGTDDVQTTDGTVTTTDPGDSMADEDGPSDADSADSGDGSDDDRSDESGTAAEDGETGASDERDDSDAAGDSESGASDGSDGSEAGDSEREGADGSLSLTPVNASAANVTDAAIAESRTVTQYRAVRNLTTDVTSNNVEQTTGSDQVFAVDRAEAAFRQSATLTTRGITQDTDAYLVNGTLYNRGQGNVRAFDSEWVKFDVGGNATATFERQDVLASSRKYLGNATLSVAGGATVDGTDVYVVEAEFDTENYTAVRGLTSPPDINGTTVYDAGGTYYIDRNTSRIERVSLTANWSSEFGGTAINQSVESVTTFAYEPVDVTLPDAADGAVEIGGGNETVSGNETETDDGDQSGDDSGDEESSDGESNGDDQSDGDDENQSDGDDESDDQSDSDDESDDQSDSDDASDDRGSADGTDDAAGGDEATAETGGIRTDGGDLAVDPDLSFARVEHVLETNVTEPARVQVLDDPRRRSTNATGFEDLFDWRTFDRTVGLDRAAPTSRNVSMGAYEVPLRWVAEVRVGGYGNVYLRSLPEMPTSLVRLLTTHEFVHYVQLQNDWMTTVNSRTDLSTDGRFASGAMIEGGATFVTDAVLEEYRLDGPRNIRLYEGLDAIVPAGSRTAYGNRQYSEGARYIAARIDDAADLQSVYENAPTTSEQVIHNYTPAAEPPAPMTLAVETNGSYVRAATDRKGEAYTRHVLANGLDFGNASAAAAGWGNDSAVTLRPTGDGNASYVWVHRWDDAGNASEFADAAREYLLQYGDYEGGTTTLDGIPARLRQPGDRTTALVIGSESFQDGLALSVEGSTVTIEAP